MNDDERILLSKLQIFWIFSTSANRSIMLGSVLEMMVPNILSFGKCMESGVTKVFAMYSSKVIEFSWICTKNQHEQCKNPMGQFFVMRTSKM